jgi:hypothetical protein
MPHKHKTIFIKNTVSYNNTQDKGQFLDSQSETNQAIFRQLQCGIGYA